jgi:predicted ATPase
VPSLVRSLPSPSTSLVGREQDIVQVAELLEAPDVRLVTLTGPGGIGKTRLALAVAERLADHYPSATVFVPLASIAEPGLVLPRVAAALGASLEGTGRPLDALVEHLGDRPTLLVLDNLEQVVGVGPELDDLLARCPGLKIVATSRTVLRLRAEHEYPVGALTVPAFSERPTLDQLTSLPAVQLFVDRARAVRRDFALNAENAVAIAEICRRLDGLPLAIELAAARVRLLDPPALLARLGSRLDALGTGPVDLPERQRTLRGTIEWSVGLLSDAEKEMLATLSVFVDGWTLEAAVSVAGLDEDRTLDLLDALAGHSLVSIIAGDYGPRFRMLETVREFAAELLAAGPTSADTQRRHAAYFRDFAESTAWPATDEIEWAERLQAEEGNLRQAIRWFLTHDVTPLPRLLRTLWRFWQLRDRMIDGRAWIDELLPRAGSLDENVQADLWLAAAMTAAEVGDDDAALVAAREVERLVGRVDDPYLRSASQMALSWTRPITDDFDGALQAASAALEGFRQLDEPFMAANAVFSLGMIEKAMGHSEAARRHLTEVHTSRGRLANSWLVKVACVQLASLAVEAGRLDEARALLDESGDEAEGTERSARTLSFRLIAFAGLLLAEGNHRPAALALGAAEGLRDRVGLRPWPMARSDESTLYARLEEACALVSSRRHWLPGPASAGWRPPPSFRAANYRTCFSTEQPHAVLRKHCDMVRVSAQQVEILFSRV